MPDNKPTINGWNEWGKHVLHELEANNTQHSSITEKLDKLILKIAIMETKMAMRSSITGMVSGGVMSIVVAVVIWIITK